VAKRAPLAGVMVVDFSTYLPGPFCTQILADLGADVVKVEQTEGDPGRALPLRLFHAVNRSKLSIALNLKRTEEVELCKRLLAKADVLVEGFRPGVMDRLGLGYEVVAAFNPSVVYCSISGYGSSGPKRDAPGHDITYMAASGALSFPGDWNQEGPQRPGLPVADLAGATFAATSILAALFARTSSGKGVHLDVSLTDAVLSMVSTRAGKGLNLIGRERLHLSPTNRIFVAKDRIHLAIGAVEEKYWAALRDIVAEVEPTVLDDKFRNAAYRWENGDELVTLLERAFLERSGLEWEERLREAGVPVERVVSIREASTSKQIESRGIVQEVNNARAVVFPVHFNGSCVGTFGSVPPALDEHRAKILKEFLPEDYGADGRKA
jgi:crotonobetainyl-CoA:carnitine CoA-transferase CaiB-like acyl-CoA transferase